MTDDIQPISIPVTGKSRLKQIEQKKGFFWSDGLGNIDKISNEHTWFYDKNTGERKIVDLTSLNSELSGVRSLKPGLCSIDLHGVVRQLDDGTYCVQGNSIYHADEKRALREQADKHFNNRMDDFHKQHEDRRQKRDEVVKSYLEEFEKEYPFYKEYILDLRIEADTSLKLSQDAMSEEISDSVRNNIRRINKESHRRFYVCRDKLFELLVLHQKDKTIQETGNKILMAIAGATLLLGVFTAEPGSIMHNILEEIVPIWLTETNR